MRTASSATSSHTKRLVMKVMWFRFLAGRRTESVNYKEQAIIFVSPTSTKVILQSLVENGLYTVSSTYRTTRLPWNLRASPRVKA